MPLLLNLWPSVRSTAVPTHLIVCLTAETRAQLTDSAVLISRPFISANLPGQLNLVGQARALDPLNGIAWPRIDLVATPSGAAETQLAAPVPGTLALATLALASPTLSPRALATEALSAVALKAPQIASQAQQSLDLGPVPLRQC